ncbi:CLOCK-interacting pacemaker isoform X2 [Pseudochaenichthys georgianus]|uniref:CLOCK-interacting pacemaker isoform X2 n=1 Tax=Pseudochaenichthys georgianus TaxID=52239 RepID=UPI001469B244|nr:CLOCK-interacting pacemaker isoform X2 [Pseudochaenichthys georgianus]
MCESPRLVGVVSSDLKLTKDNSTATVNGCCHRPCSAACDPADRQGGSCSVPELYWTVLNEHTEERKPRHSRNNGAEDKPFKPRTSSGKEMSTKRKSESHSRAANRPRMTKSGSSGVESERDSGFSDASSEHMSTMDTTDSEKSPIRVVQNGLQTSGSGSHSSQLAAVGGSYSSLSPMIIMNNVLLKQPGESPPAMKQWGFSPTVEVVQQPQVVFLRPVVSRQTSPAPKEAPSRHRHPKKYLPILKSYPKIAPHPGDSSSSSGRGTASSSSSNTSSSSHSFSSSSSSHSSSSSGSERGNSLTSNHREHCQREKQQRNLCGGASNSASTTPSLSSTPSTTSPLLQRRLSLPTAEASASSSPARERPSSAVSQAEFSTSLSVTHTDRAVQEESSSAECDHSDADAKRKRFCNTYNVLSKSGLLDIALRTKELHRQNRRTQSDLDRLKEHTDLFLQALCSGDTSICLKLQASLPVEEGEKGRAAQTRAAQTSLKAD